MKDRQFMTLLGLVVAAGLVMGLIAFRMTGSSAAVATASVSNTAVASRNASQSSADDGVVEPPVEPAPLSTDAGSSNGEPATPAKDPPEMQGPGTGDAPRPAAEPAPQPDAPAETPSVSTPQ